MNGGGGGGGGSSIHLPFLLIVRWGWGIVTLIHLFSWCCVTLLILKCFVILKSLSRGLEISCCCCYYYYANTTTSNIISHGIILYFLEFLYCCDWN